ncbi:glycosyltransferase family 4 protein [Paraburkholderia sp. EG287B]|uniref:glycosyltransferase family 4 protein n=1 Tax=unclassified Paraburkholderia TaxID=2615204 RepID=UPI0034D34FBE
MMRNTRPLRVLTWHVHGNYLYYLTQAPHDFHVVTRPGRPAGYAGRAGVLPWGANVHEVAAEDVASNAFDVVVYQQRSHWEHDRFELLSDAQRRLPRVYIEHDPPQEAPFAQRHWVDDRGALLVHVTPFNALMWDSGATPTRVVEHGVLVPEGVRYTGTTPRGVVVVNHLRERGRRLGADVFEQVRREVPLDLVGMDAQSLGGIGEISNVELARFVASYRFFFNPIRWTSLGLAIVEAMMVGLPIVGLATTELPSVIRDGKNGFIDTRIDRLVDCMRTLIRDPALARRLGEGARRDALERFSIDRFAQDWDLALREVTA